MLPVSDDGAAEPPLEAAGCDAAVLELGVGVAPPLHADATIATAASGPARRRKVCFVVNVDSPLIVVTGIAGRDAAGSGRRRDQVSSCGDRTLSWRRPVRSGSHRFASRGHFTAAQHGASRV
jgi:hypothetical protein